MNKEEILRQIAETERDIADSRRSLAEARKRWDEAESALISAKLKKEKLEEALRVNKATIPGAVPEKSLRDLDIEEFRENHPELVEWAKERDRNKGELS